MKNIILLLSLVLTVSFVSCSKDEATKKEKYLIGTWKLVEAGKIVDGKEVKEDLTECDLKSTFNFKKDKKLIAIIYDVDGEDCVEKIEKDDWNLKDNNILINRDKADNTTSFNIKELTKNKFKFYVAINGEELYYYSLKK